jgi:hypothetical protein
VTAAASLYEGAPIAAGAAGLEAAVELGGRWRGGDELGVDNCGDWRFF